MARKPESEPFIYSCFLVVQILYGLIYFNWLSEAVLFRCAVRFQEVRLP